jgi:hypothetical protein
MRVITPVEKAVAHLESILGPHKIRVALPDGQTGLRPESRRQGGETPTFISNRDRAVQELENYPELDCDLARDRLA